jgi:hypothetical protein
LVQLNLTIVNSSTNSISASACNSYTANNGQVYTTSGTYTQNFINAAGCDSTLTILLDVYYSSTNTINATGCTDYIAPNGVTYTQEGTYTVTIPTFYGCDSVITINLALGSLDISVNQITAGFQANESQAIYQWLDCSNNFAPISGEVNREFFPNSTGNYAVQISKNGCVDTSECYTYLPVTLFEMAISETNVLYPNPANDFIYLFNNDGEKFNRLTVFDLSGKRVLALENNASKLIEANVSNLENGVYFLEISNNKSLKRLKFIKQSN